MKNETLFSTEYLIESEKDVISKTEGLRMWLMAALLNNENVLLQIEISGRRKE